MKIEYWNELSDSELFNIVFTRPVPISEVELEELSVNYFNNNIHFKLHLPLGVVPDAPPRKWLTQPFNRCRIVLNAGGVINLNYQLTNLTLPEEGTFKIYKSQSGSFNIVYKSNTTSIALDSQFLNIGGPSVYLEEP